MLSQPQVCVDYSLPCLGQIQDFRGGGSNHRLLKTVPCRVVWVHSLWKICKIEVWHSEAKSGCDLGLQPPLPAPPPEPL